MADTAKTTITTLDQYIEFFLQHSPTLATRDHALYRLQLNASEFFNHPVKGLDLEALLGEEPTFDGLLTLYEHPRADEILNELLWVAREDLRRMFVDGFHPPSWLEQLPSERRDQLWYHFPHPSVVKPGERDFVAYTPDHEYGKRDRQVRVKVGRYLTQFYGDLLSEGAIRAIVNGLKPLKLIFGTEEDHFVAAYEAMDGSSCIGGHRRWEYDIHPASVYAGSGDFRIAALVPESGPDDAFDKAVARAVVFKDEGWVRVYGPEATALREQLEARGLPEIDGYYGGRLRRILVAGGSATIAPYVDGSADHGTESYCGRYWELDSKGGVDFSSTQGYVELEDLEICDCCGDHVPAGNLDHSCYTDESYCEACRDNGNVVLARVSRRGGYSWREDWVSNDNVVLIGDHYYVDDEDMLIDNGFTRCDQNGHWFDAENAVTTLDDERVDPYECNVFPCGEFDGDEKYAVLESDLLVDHDFLLAYHIAKDEPGQVVLTAIFHPESDEVRAYDEGIEADPQYESELEGTGRRPSVVTSNVTSYVGRFDDIVRRHGPHCTISVDSYNGNWNSRHRLQMLAQLHLAQLQREALARQPELIPVPEQA